MLKIVKGLPRGEGLFDYGVYIDLSIFRVGSGSGRAQKKILLFRAEKFLPMTILLGASGLNFRAGLGPGPGLGISGRARAKKNFTGFKISTHARPVRYMCRVFRTM
jgi:hypothetical protein